VKVRIAAAAALAVGLVFTTAGCTFFAPQATLIPYAASDGIDANVGAIQLRNVFVVAPNGTDANMIGVLINTGKVGQTVTFQFASYESGVKQLTNSPVLVPAGAVISFGNPGVPQLVFRGANVKPGALLSIFVQYGDVTGKTLLLPVLDGSQTAYSGLTPSPTPTPVPIPTITATAKPVTK
jgi:hypothetical protein